MSRSYASILAELRSVERAVQRNDSETHNIMLVMVYDALVALLTKLKEEEQGP